MRAQVIAFGVFIIACLPGGCSRENSARIDYAMGDQAPVGPLSYTVIETSWQTQLGDVLKLRVPQQRFLVMRISVTNGGGSELSIPLLQLESYTGQTYQESQDGEGLANWLGLLRTLRPAETLQGQILFDVPLTSYRLRVPDGAGAGAEKYAWISIPLRMDVDTQPLAPASGGFSQ
ncbi:MAG: DUF4352 domain-containing protein [Bryobacterales bacterium]|nr:DUF4352 domain-containing protein [Bryobacterales bacterium]